MITAIARKPRVFRAPTLVRFFRSDTLIRGIMGPFGSGKSAACAREIVLRAHRQQPSPVPIQLGSKLYYPRYSKWTVIADTYPNIHRKVLDTWFGFGMPRELGHFTGGGPSGPSRHEHVAPLGDGTAIHLIVEFAAIGDHDVETFMRGYQPTGYWIFEGDTLPIGVFKIGKGRLGRYPDVDPHGGASWNGMITDFNAPNTDTEFYEYFFEDPSEDIEVFIQPGGLEPDAENHEFLKPSGPEYYQRLINDNDEFYVQRFVHNKMGYSRDGKPVAAHFNPGKHVSVGPLKVLDSLIVCGVDAGRTPNATFWQRDSEGQKRCVGHEGAEDTAAPEFGEMVSEYRAIRFPGRKIVYVLDPDTYIAGDQSDVTWAELFQEALGEPVRAAKTNDYDPRLAAVNEPMRKDIRPGKPGLIVDPEFKKVIRTFSGSWKYQKVVGTTGQYQDKPKKDHPWSDIGDTSSYALMELSDVVEREERKVQREARLKRRGRDRRQHPHSFLTGSRGRAA